MEPTSDTSEDGENYYDDYNDYTDDLSNCGDYAKAQDEDPEYFKYDIVSEKRVQEIFGESISHVLTRLPAGSRSDLAKLLLVQSHWNVDIAVEKFRSVIRPPEGAESSSSKDVMPSTSGGTRCCQVCFEVVSGDQLDGAACGHSFCPDCWDIYLEECVEKGHGFDIPCMGSKCGSTLDEDFVWLHLQKPEVSQKFREHLLRDCIESHPNLTKCPTSKCDQIFYTQEVFSNKKVDCPKCLTSFCFTCGGEYHLPCDCQTMRRWWKKSFQDSATMTYLSSHTKDCPNPICQRSIEKNGGCNHMKCQQCGSEFCWVCLGDWAKHTKNYYECNKFSAQKADEESKGKVSHLLANGSDGRRALVKYLFHYERWKNHAHSLQLEEKFMKDVENRVEKQVKTKAGSFIDWQFLLDAGKLLLKCRRSLQYTYALAYYMEEGSRRQLFEHLQADLELEIESISYAIEKEKDLDIAKLQAQMRSAEFRRRSLILDSKVTNLPVNFERRRSLS